MIATDVVTDAELVRDLLKNEFDHIVLSTDADHTVEDFEKHRPALLILAFNQLEKAKLYYLGLYRLSEKVHDIPHRTLILSNKNDLKSVYTLCKKAYFDDFILFWPPPNDPFRLPYSVYRALKELQQANEPTVEDFAGPARHLSGLDALIEKHTETGNRFMEQSVQSAQQAESTALDRLEKCYASLSSKASGDAGATENGAIIERELEQLKKEGIEKPFKHLDKAMQPMRQWAENMRTDLEPHLEATRTLSKLSAQVPIILMVDDDKFQHKLIKQILINERLKLEFATSGTEALGILRRCRPDLILMDVNLDNENGIEVTQRIKAVKQFTTIPVIMITGEGAKDIVVDSVKAGAVDFIVKPFNTSTLIKKIYRFINHPAGMSD
ncbi:response regulator [Sedimenticola thiotaurini]|nr:response regulator [Sedimenticola thiotaurini]